MSGLEQKERHTIESVFALQKENLLSLRARSAQERKAKLQKIYDWILSHQDAIRQALYADLRKPFEESDLTEIFIALSEIKHAIRHLKRWMKPHKVGKTLPFLTTKAWVRYEPKGRVLVISPWNFPFHLAVVPLASAVAAGNAVTIKPSEYAPHTSALVRRLVQETFEPQEAVVWEGDYTVAQALLKLPFDHIFFTGSTRVGKLVMKAASEHLTSVTLELGGKSPVIVDRTANLRDAAQKVAFGKYLNSGQTCIAPDYLLVHRQVRARFESLLKKEITRMFAANKNAVRSPYYARIISETHHARLNSLLQDSLRQGGRLIFGGESSGPERFLAPTIVSEVQPDSPLMREEIFGPILPIIPFEKTEEVVSWVRRIDKPLALYIFSHNKKFIRRITDETDSGGVCINDLMLQYLHLNLPFGGVGSSGWGNAHGFYGFKTFAQERAFLKQGLVSPLKWMYPPYTPRVRRLIRWLIRWLT